jgi:hypothetical protein
MFALLKIRYCQLKYELKHLGVAHILFLCAMPNQLFSSFYRTPQYKADF